MYIMLHFCIPKANDPVAKTFDFLCTQLVLFNLQIVNITIYLDNQPALGAVKVCDKCSHRCLAAELESAQLAIT